MTARVFATLTTDRDNQYLMSDSTIVRAGQRLHLFHLFGYGLVLIGVFVAARQPKPA